MKERKENIKHKTTIKQGNEKKKDLEKMWRSKDERKKGDNREGKMKVNMKKKR